MAEKKSIMLYLDTIDQWDMLTDEQAGKLIKALLRFGNTGEQFETTDGMLRMAFGFIAAQIERDNEKWEKTCEKRREAVAKRWNKNNTKDTSEYNSIQVNTKDTDTVTDTVTDINNNIIGAEKSAPPPTKSKRFVKPTIDQIKAYCQERHSSVSPDKFYNYYESNGWRVGKSAMKDWKAAVRSWESNGYNHKSESSVPDDVDKYKCVINQF